MKILVVDDDPLAGAITSAILEDVGHDTVLAENAVAALETLGTEGGVELVVSDMHMPLVSGLFLFHEMRELGHGQPFILLTGDDPRGLGEKTAGMAGWLMKDEHLEQELPALVARVKDLS